MTKEVFTMDNQFDDIDNIIFDYFKTNQEIPPTIEYSIKNALYTDKINKFNIIEIIRKIIITIITLLTVGGGIVFAKEIGQFLDNIFNNRKGISSAIDNGYISNTNMKYVESNKLGIKVENILMDDYNFNIKFNINLSQQDINIDEINDMDISKMIIYDENNNVLYCNNEEIFDSWSNKNKIDFKIDNFSEKNINSGLNYYINEKILENNQLNLVYNLSAYNSVYPKSKKIYLDIEKIVFNTNNKKICADGNWNIELDVPEQFYNREAILYKQKETNDEKIEIIEAIAYDTGFNFKVKVEEKQNNNQNINENELWNAMEQEYIKYNNTTQEGSCENGEHHYIGDKTEQFMLDYYERIEPLKNIYIENENGKKFYITESTSENGVVDRTSNENYFTYSDTFDITKYDITNILTIHFQYKGIDKIIIIEKQ